MNKIVKIEFQISNQCNKKCWFCPAFNLNSKNNVNIIDEKIIDKVVNILKTKPNLFENVIHISFDRYNEPFIYYDLIYKYIKKFKNIEKKIYYTINTNGDLITKQNNNILNLFDFVQINDYDSKNKNEALQKINNKFEKIKKILFDDKNKVIYFNNIMYYYNRKNTLQVRNRGNTIHINNISSREQCNIIGKFLMIDVNGDVFPCCEISNMFIDNSILKCGNILEDNIEDIVLTMNNLNIQDIKECKQCIADLNMFI